MKKILLVNPPVYDFAAYDLWAKPLGLLYLSSVLKQNKFEVNLLDYTYRHFGSLESKSNAYGCGHYIKQSVQKPEALKDIPKNYTRYGISKDTAESYLSSLDKPDIILVTSVMTYWYLGVFEAIRSLKSFFPDTPIVLGGTYASLCYEHAKKNSGADHVIKGGFYPLNKVLKEKDFEADMPKNFAGFPPPDFCAYGKKEYAVLRMTSGCPFRCSYCAQDILCEGKFEKKSWEKVFEEVKSFAGSGIKNIAFYDDALLYDADNNIKPLLRQIIKEGLAINIHTPNGLHARYLDLELAKLMKEAGFIMPRFSLETADSDLQKETGAKISNEEFVSAIGFLREAGYKNGEYIAYLLIGMPGQKLSDADMSIRLANSLGAKVSLSEYSVIPHTKDFIKAGKKFADEPLLHNKSVFPLFNLNQWNEIFRVKSLAIKLNSLL